MSLDGVDLHFVDSVADAAAMMRWLGERRPEDAIACDTETTGLDTRTDVVRLCQFGDDRVGWAVPWHLFAGAALEVLQKFEGRLIFHNAKFDVSMLERYGWKCDWRRVEDTRALGWVVNPSQSTALKNLASRYVDTRAAGLQRTLDDALTAQGWTWETVPYDFQQYWGYAGLDCVLTAQLFAALDPTLDEGRRRAYELEVTVLPVIAAMERKGAHVDTEYAAQKRDEFQAYVRDAQAWAKEAHGVSLTADQQCVRRLQELGVQLTETTPSGSHFSVAKDVVDGLLIDARAAGDTPVVEFLEQMRLTRRLSKAAGTYLDKLASCGGVAYGSTNPLGAPKTSRMSITGTSTCPALQTLPRADGDNPAAITVRDCFVAAEGSSLCMVDFDQIELRLLAHFSGDPTMIDVLSGDGDPFTEFARRIYGDSTIVKKDPRRQLTKNASYAKAYGAGAARFSLTAGVTLAQGTAFLEAFDAQFPGVVAFQRRVERIAKQRVDAGEAPHVRTPFGHALQVASVDKAYKLVNYLLQGTAANVMKWKLLQLDAAGFTPYMVLPVHDEVILEVPNLENPAAVARGAAEVMQETEMFSVALTVGADGPFQRWGDKYK